MTKLSGLRHRDSKAWHAVILLGLVLAGCKSSTKPAENAGTGGNPSMTDAGTMDSGVAGPCSGPPYFIQHGMCAPTHDQQLAKSVPNQCSRVRVYVGTCEDSQVWSEVYQGLGDPVLCVYQNGALVGARVCTDTSMPSWNCDGSSASLVSCLRTGKLVDDHACMDALTTTCDTEDAGTVD